MAVRVVVSLSLDAEDVVRWKSVARESGQSFSALVGDLARRGENLDRGLFSSTATRAENDDTQTEASDDEDTLDHADPRQVTRAHDTRDDGGHKEAQPPELGPSKPGPSDPSRPLAERVYSALAPEQRPLEEVAAELAITEDELASMIEKLEAQGEPARLRVIEGKWFCWEER